MNRIVQFSFAIMERSILQRTPNMIAAAVALGWLMNASAVLAQTTAFTYQGKLTDSGSPANARYDFTVTLWDAATGGAQIGPLKTIRSENARLKIKLAAFAARLERVERRTARRR